MTSNMYIAGKTITDLAIEMLDFFKYNADELPKELDDEITGDFVDLCGEKYLPDEWYKQLFDEVKRIAKQHEESRKSSKIQ